MKRELVIGTRPSKLALWQAEHVKALLENQFDVTVTLKKITTKGDKILDRSLVEVGGKGLFLKEIEDALLAGDVDLAVHSMKDVPHTLPEGLGIAAILKRDDPSDVWISREAVRIEDAKVGTLVGTTSLRRKIQLQKLYPGLVFQDLRGNVDTRIAKLDRGEFGAIVLASAGLKRLGLWDRVTHSLDIVSAVGQGAIGVECRLSDEEMHQMLAALNDDLTQREVNLEREFLKKVQGSCQTPLGCRVTADSKDASRFMMRCFLSKPDGADFFEKTVGGLWSEGEKVVAGIFL